MSNENLKFKGTVVLERRNKDGSVIDHEDINNLIVNVGKTRIARLLNANGGSAVSEFKYIAIGTGTTGVAAGDTALETEVDRAIADSSGGTYEADYKAIWEKTFTFDSGESYNITEAGVSDSAVASGECLLDRFTFTAKSVDSDTDLYVKVTVTVS